MRLHTTQTLLALSISIAMTGRLLAQEKNDAPIRFKKIRLTEEYYAEGASVGDFNHDGRTDIVSGPHWFEGPTFEKRHTFYQGMAFPNDRGYSDNFFSYVQDFSGDGWDDVLVVGLPGTPAYWYENPKGDGTWEKHLAFPAVDNEAPTFADLTGDGVPELCFHNEGRLGYASPSESNPRQRWDWRAVSEQHDWHRYMHGLGIGDINDDGRNDFLMPSGWWEQPVEGVDQTPWKHHASKFADGGAEIYAFDVDGDGDNDVVSSQQAHAWGLSWFEHVKKDGEITFIDHKIMGEKPSDNPFGVVFSQLHAIDCADVDGDGRRDIVTGKCYWAHNGSDPGARQPAVVYWFRNVVKDGEVVFVPHRIDKDSGVGRQIRAVDANNDGRVDVVAANKKGTFVFLQQ